MIAIQLNLHEQTVSDAIGAANLQGLSFNDYVEWRLNVDLDAAVEHGTQPTTVPDQSVEEVAKALFLLALDQPAMEANDEYTVEGRFYLVEDLYKQLEKGSAWNLRDRGNRIMIGKAFKRLVDANNQKHGGIQIDDGRVMKVIFEKRTSQNQAVYRTHRVA